MKLHSILYSRTASQDYRWILMPDVFSSEDFEVLRTYFREYSSVISVSGESGIPGIVCLRLTKSVVCCRCELTQNVADPEGRPVVALHGFACDLAYANMFWLLVPAIIRLINPPLNVWSINDLKSLNTAKNLSVEHDVPVEAIVERLIKDQPNLNASVAGQIDVTASVFARDSYDQLYFYLLNLGTGFREFVFGANEETWRRLRPSTLEVYGRFGKRQVFSPYIPPRPKTSSPDLNAVTAKEYCEIRMVYNNSENSIFPKACRSVFFQAVSLTDGKRTLGEKSDLTKHNDSATDLSPSTIEVFDAYVKQLLKSGWSIRIDRGQHWWNARLERYVKAGK